MIRSSDEFLYKQRELLDDYMSKPSEDLNHYDSDDEGLETLIVDNSRIDW